MQVYMVGGAVRDKLLGVEAKDVDYVVVGASHDDMLKLGFKQVGADFPVYLHPTSGDEWALARTERKSGKGYNGFTTETSGVTLEDDLRRRDLTMNAMAMKDGVLHDPYGGQADLQAGVLRHVSEAFADDPLRVLRVARFAARYNFVVAPETVELMKGMVAAGELAHLTFERCWKEMDRALEEPHPKRFFDVLAEVGALHNKLVPFFYMAFKDAELLEEMCEQFDRCEKYGNLPFYVVAGNFANLKPGFLKESTLVHKTSVAYQKLSSLRVVKDPKLVAEVMRETVHSFEAAVYCVMVHDLHDNAFHFPTWLWAMRKAYDKPTAGELTAKDPSLEGKALGDALKAARVEAVTAGLAHWNKMAKLGDAVAT